MVSEPSPGLGDRPVTGGAFPRKVRHLCAGPDRRSHGRNFTLNQTLQQALKASDGKLPKGIDLALSGHMHIFELLSFADRRAPQLIVGTGGTLLDPKIGRRLDGVTVGGAKVGYGRWEHRFGFLMIAPTKKSATATFVNDRGKASFECMLTPSTARCH
jgi:hypothetical protein